MPGRHLFLRLFFLSHFLCFDQGGEQWSRKLIQAPSATFFSSFFTFYVLIRVVNSGEGS
jgi:hypothetical protein